MNFSLSTADESISQPNLNDVVDQIIASFRPQEKETVRSYKTTETLSLLRTEFEKDPEWSRETKQ